MFDFGFWEIILILMVALIVVGPERLPGLARTAGLWVGKAKRFVSEVKAEIDQELAADELKKALDKQEAMSDVYDIIEETRNVTRDIKQEINKSAESVTADDKQQTVPEEKSEQASPEDQQPKQHLP
jgi:sec-independent protein translocase protein TatB